MSDSTRPLLVGESNPYGADPYYALYPAPDGCSGHRLCVKILGLTRKTYLETFDRVNLCDGPWSITRAKARAPAAGVQSLFGIRPDVPPLDLSSRENADTAASLRALPAMGNGGERDPADARDGCRAAETSRTVSDPCHFASDWNYVAAAALGVLMLGALLFPRRKK